jgi:hypothetical protein
MMLPPSRPTIGTRLKSAHAKLVKTMSPTASEVT